MPQTDFFADSSDSERIARCVFSLNLQLVPDLLYEAPHVQVLASWEDLKKFPECKLFFVLNYEQIQSPFQFAYVPNENAYRIHQRKGGPSLSLLICPPYEQDGVRWIPSGMLSYYPTHRNTTTLEEDRISGALVARYRRLATEIKRDSRLAGRTRRYWVMPEAYRALNAGAQLNVPGVVINQAR